MDRVSLKEYAKERVRGRRVEIWKALVFVFLGSMIVGWITPTFNVSDLYYNSPTTIIPIFRTLLITSLITTFLTMPLTYGANQYLMDFDTDKHTNDTIFVFYKQILKIFVLTVFIGIITQCFSIIAVIILIAGQFNEVSVNVALLLISIGQFVAIYLSYSFVAVPFIFNENKEKSIMEIMKLSYDMMKGHKLEYFVLELSFLGWYLLALCTCGILLIWLHPYTSFTTAKYFLDIKNEYYGVGVEATVVSESEEASTAESNDSDPFTIG